MLQAHFSSVGRAAQSTSFYSVELVDFQNAAFY